MGSQETDGAVLAAVIDAISVLARALPLIIEASVVPAAAVAGSCTIGAGKAAEVKQTDAAAATAAAAAAAAAAAPEDEAEDTACS